MRIVRFLGNRHAGYTRSEIAENVGLSPNGDLTKMLKALIGGDFVTRYVPYGISQREEHYKLSDCFCWFWLHFKESRRITETDYWQHHLRESEIASWRGIAFEEVCMQHIQQIKSGLQIAGVSSSESALIVTGDGSGDGMQIDLLIDRNDDVVNVCEMKFYKSSFVVSKAYAGNVSKRIARLESDAPSKSFRPTLISCEPLHLGEHSDIFTSTLTLDDLFTAR